MKCPGALDVIVLQVLELRFGFDVTFVVSLNMTISRRFDILHRDHAMAQHQLWNGKVWIFCKKSPKD